MRWSTTLLGVWEKTETTQHNRFHSRSFDDDWYYAFLANCRISIDEDLVIPLERQLEYQEVIQDFRPMDVKQERQASMVTGLVQAEW